MQSFIIVFAMQPYLWPMLRMRIIQRGFSLKPLYEICLESKIWLKFYQIAMQLPCLCRLKLLSKFWLYFCSSSSQMSCCLIWRWLFVGYHFEQYLFLIRIKWKSSEITTTIILKNGIFFLTFIWKIFFFA